MEEVPVRYHCGVSVCPAENAWTELAVVEANETASPGRRATDEGFSADLQRACRITEAREEWPALKSGSVCG